MVDTFIYTYENIGGMWPFTQKKETPKPESYTSNWKKEMLLRWTDLDARVTALELADREYKKARVRTKIQYQDDSKDIYNGMFLPKE